MSSSYAPLVDVGDHAYAPGYRGEMVSFANNSPAYSGATKYNPVADELNNYISGRSYLSSMDDLAVMENPDITKIETHHVPTTAVMPNLIRPVKDSYNISLWMVFLVFIAIIMGWYAFDMGDTGNTSQSTSV
jgi:hypothetical protein